MHFSQAHLAPALTALHPYVTAGSVRAIFLGDEMMLAGISAANITAAADFVRAALGPGMVVFCGTLKHSLCDMQTHACCISPIVTMIVSQ